MWDKDKDFRAGISFKETNNYPEAFKSFDKARKAHPEIPQYWHCAGHMLVLVNEKNKAKGYLQKAVELYDEEDHEQCFWIGAAYSLMQDKKNALEYLAKAVQIDNFSNYYRQEALKEEDYAFLKDDPGFMELTRKRTPGESYEEFSDYHINRMKKANKVFIEIDEPAFDYYLAAPFLKDIYIPENKTHKLDPYIEDYFLKLVKDTEGNIVDIIAPSDMWQIELFKELAGIVREGSYIMFVDDVWKYWKVEFHNKQVKYFKQD